jgi:adenylate cyclase
MSVDAVFDWLLDGVPDVTTPIEIADRLAHGLREGGIPITRLGVFVTTLHPNVAGRAFIWEEGKPTRMAIQTQAVRASMDYTSSPIAWCSEKGEVIRWKKGDPDLGWQAIRDFAARGCVDYICIPLRFSNGEIHVMSATSDVGFSDDHIAALHRVARPLARVTEIYALRRLAGNILDAYVGPHSGAKVLAGRIQKGDVETIHAAIWFSDLRGFTALSGERSATEMIGILNDVFECQVPAIEANGGEVLKFIGDGMLAIFPFEAGAPADACARALTAAKAALEALATMNAKAGTDYRLGLALHVGDIAYGNIGGAARLDFTAIGSAVNTAARLEGVAGKVGRPLVLSQEFGEVVGGDLEDLGAFELKGIPEPRRVFAPKSAAI